MEESDRLYYLLFHHFVMAEEQFPKSIPPINGKTITLFMSSEKQKG